MTAATLFSGCDTDETFSETSEFTPRAGLSKGLVSDIKIASAAFEDAMAQGYALPKPKGCAVIENYGALLQDYLVAAAQHEVEETADALHAMHEHLRCATAREFVMFFRALHSSLLADAYDKDQPILREVDELAVPLAVLLQDMGARSISAELGAWLYLRGEPIRALAHQKHSVLDDLDIIVPHGLTTRRVAETEKTRVYDAIANSAILGRCATSDLITPDGVTPFCPQDCDNVSQGALDPELGKHVSGLCDAAQDLLAPLDAQPVKDAMFGCVEQYKAATSQDGFAACITTRFHGLSEDDLSLSGSTQVHISKQCQLSQGQPTLTPEEKKDLIQARKETIAALELVKKRLESEKAELDGLNNGAGPHEDDAARALRSETVDANIDSLDEDLGYLRKEVENLEEGAEGEGGGEGTQRCAHDTEACSDSCDIQSQVQQLTQDCLEQTEAADQPSNPDPIDPPGPEVDPDSPLGEFMDCLAKAAVGEEPSDQESCESQLTCADGEVAVEFSGLCVCEVARTPLVNTEHCSWQINCTDDMPCDCDGAPMSGNPIPRPEDPFLIFEFRG